MFHLDIRKLERNVIGGALAFSYIEIFRRWRRHGRSSVKTRPVCRPARGEIDNRPPSSLQTQMCHLRNRVPRVGGRGRGRPCVVLHQRSTHLIFPQRKLRCKQQSLYLMLFPCLFQLLLPPRNRIARDFVPEYHN